MVRRSHSNNNILIDKVLEILINHASNIIVPILIEYINYNKLIVGHLYLYH